MEAIPKLPLLGRYFTRGFELGVEEDVGSKNVIIVDKYVRVGVDVDIGDTLGLCVVGINVSEAFVLGVEDEVNSENDSIVSKHEKNKSGVVFVGSVGIMGLVYILVMD